MTNAPDARDEESGGAGFVPLRMIGDPQAPTCGPLGCLLPPLDAFGEALDDTGTPGVAQAPERDDQDGRAGRDGRAEQDDRDD